MLSLAQPFVWPVMLILSPFFNCPIILPELYFQFLKLSQTAGLNASELNQKVLVNKGILTGKGQAFITAAGKYSINEVYLISHALLETGNGTSELANGIMYNGKKVYNMYGIGAYA